MSWSRLHWISLTVDFHTRLLSCSLLYFILLHPSQEIISAFRMPQMLDTDVDLLRDDPIAQLLVDHNSHCSPRHVEHSPRLPVVVLVRHSLLHCSVTFYIDDAH